LCSFFAFFFCLFGFACLFVFFVRSDKGFRRTLGRLLFVARR